jgi:hypothetical protein
LARIKDEEEPLKLYTFNLNFKEMQELESLRAPNVKKNEDMRQIIHNEVERRRKLLKVQNSITRDLSPMRNIPLSVIEQQPAIVTSTIAGGDITITSIDDVRKYSTKFKEYIQQNKDDIRKLTDELLPEAKGPLQLTQTLIRDFHRNKNRNNFINSTMSNRAEVYEGKQTTTRETL